MSEPNQEDVGQATIYVGYGAVMHQFQMLELDLWGFLTKGIKSGASFDQAMAKVEKWNATTFGSLWRGMRTQPHWPADLKDKLERAVEVRNYLSHHFLREYFVVERSADSQERAAQALADQSIWLEGLSDELEAHAASQGIPGHGELDEETSTEIDKLRPKKWFYFMDDNEDEQQPSQP